MEKRVFPILQNARSPYSFGREIERPMFYCKVFYLILLLGPLFSVREGLPKPPVDRGIVSSIVSSSTPSSNLNGIMQTIKVENEERLENGIPFEQNGEHFYYIATPPEGSGGFITETIFWAAPDGTLHPIIFNQAGEAYEGLVNKGEFILTGGAGILFAAGKLRFKFFIANEGDAHCCPTAGKISGTYKMVGAKQFDPGSKQYSCTYRLLAETYKRAPISSTELASYGL